MIANWIALTVETVERVEKFLSDIGMLVYLT